MDHILRIHSITQLNTEVGLPAPQHPLIAVYEDRDVFKTDHTDYEGVRISSDMYVIMFKDKIEGSLQYGRTSYDFQHGTLVFIAPGQVMAGHAHEYDENNESWMLVFHPDLIRRSTLADKMNAYSFFAYETNEALHLSVDEQAYLSGVIKQIRKEYSQNLDTHSHRLIISNLELLLNNCLRFYDRQFYTRTGFNQDLITEFEYLLNTYFQSGKPLENGIPTVRYFGNELNMSPNYLSDMLKKETGMSAKGHITKKIIDKAKTALLNSNLPINQIAYDLGFKYPQSLTRLFKSKTGCSPNEYRNMN